MRICYVYYSPPQKLRTIQDLDEHLCRNHVFSVSRDRRTTQIARVRGCVVDHRESVAFRAPASEPHVCGVGASGTGILSRAFRPHVDDRGTFWGGSWASAGPSARARGCGRRRSRGRPVPSRPARYAPDHIFCQSSGLPPSATYRRIRSSVLSLFANRPHVTVTPRRGDDVVEQDIPRGTARRVLSRPTSPLVRERGRGRLVR